MNIIFISPHYPPNYALFCAALRERGAAVLGIGDAPAQALSPDLARALSDYIHVRDMSAYDDMLRAVGLFVHRHGRIDAIESHNEHWIETEARLRDDFNVPGLRAAEARLQRSKSGMAQVLATHGLAGPQGAPVRSGQQLESFAREHGFPLFFKPDVGVGAEQAFRVDDEAALRPVLASPPEGFVVQRFIEGRITTFDGLADRDGRVVFAASLVYSDTIFDIRNDGREVYFHTRRAIPPALAALGQRVVEAFDVRARFFHIEFFEEPGGAFTPLEINLRPPGGFCTDLMNFAHDIDLYRLWARVMLGDDLADAQPAAPYHAAHVGRRRRDYLVPDRDVPAFLGPALVARPPVPPGLAIMGDPIFLLRHHDEGELERLARGLLARG